MEGFNLPIKGRGTAANPANRFERIDCVPETDPDQLALDDAPHKPATQYLVDHSKSLISYNDSPDIPFNVSLNPYRGCEHGCVYCYARPTHEYLGFSAGLDFETQIMVKLDAAKRLSETLQSVRWTPQWLALSGVTDPYQPVERKLTITRQCLEVLLAFRNPVGIVTKNHLVTRDIDLLSQLAGFNAAGVYVSVTTLDTDLARKLEPRTSHPKRRLEAIRKLADAQIPVGVFVAPIIPGLTDHEVPRIIEAAADAGASYAGKVMLRLPHGVGPLFEQWLTDHYPDRARRVMQQVKTVRSGKVNESRFHKRMRGQGVYAEQIDALFAGACRRAGLSRGSPHLSTDSFRRASGGQLHLFDQT